MQGIQNGAFSNPQAERGLLGCWLTDWASAREIADFAPEDFTGQQEGLLFRVLFALHQAGENYDPLLLEGKARTLGMTAEEARLVSIAAAEAQSAFPLLINQNTYGLQVQEAAKRRTLARNAQQLQQALAEQTVDPEDALARFESNVAQKKRGADAGVSLRGALLEALEIFERRSRGETAGILVPVRSAAGSLYGRAAPRRTDGDRRAAWNRQKRLLDGVGVGGCKAKEANGCVQPGNEHQPRCRAHDFSGGLYRRRKAARRSTDC